MLFVRCEGTGLVDSRATCAYGYRLPLVGETDQTQHLHNEGFVSRP